MEYPRTPAEIDADVTPADLFYPPGNLLRYGADPTGGTDVSAAFESAIEQCLEEGGADVVFPPGRYRQTASVTADDFAGLRIFGYGATLDFRCNSAIALGDHSTNPQNEFTQTVPTARDIVIAGLTFKPAVNGWDDEANRFRYQSPIDLSAVENVVVRDCRFEDWDFAAINISAPSRHVLVERCFFRESEESDVAYGVRPFAHVVGASTDNYDEETGTLAYAAPSVYHQDITVRDCYFYQCSHGIMSWNVHHASYVNNVFEKPTVRTLSITSWNFDVLVQGNKHIITNNATQTVSTALGVGIGSQRVIIADEHIQGALSGTSPNNSLKLIDIAGVNEGIVIENCSFDVASCSNTVVIGPNAGVTIRGCHFHSAPMAVKATIVINSQSASPVATPAFNQPEIRIIGNTDYLNSRFVELAGSPPGGTSAEAIVIQDNVFKTALTDRFVATNTNTSGWKVRARGNQFTGGTPSYVVDFGTAKTVFQDADLVVLSGTTAFAASTTAAVSPGVALPGTGYRVVTTANASGTYWVTSKTATGFTLNTAASSSSSVDWLVIPG